MNRIRSAIAVPFFASLAGPLAAQPVQPGSPPANALNPVPAISELRQFLEQIDRVLVTRQSSLPAIAMLGGGSLQISGIGAFEPGLESQRLLGLRIDLDAPGLEPEDRVAYLDLHEVEALLRGLGSLALVAAEGGRGLETEARIVTIEGFGLGVWVHEGTTRYQVRGGAEGRVVGHVSAKSFASLQDLIETARDRLFNGS